MVKVYESKEKNYYSVKFGLELTVDCYDDDYEMDYWTFCDCFRDYNYVIYDKVKEIVSENRELQEIGVELYEDDIDADNMWFVFRTTPDNVKNAVELIRKYFTGIEGTLAEIEDVIQINYRPATYWGPDSWDEANVDVEVDYEIGDVLEEPEILEDWE